MMVDLKVMAYFKISLSTRNWDRAKRKGVAALPPCHLYRPVIRAVNMRLYPTIGQVNRLPHVVEDMLL